MFGGESFYHQLLMKYITVFGSCFSNVVIKRNASSTDPAANNVTQVMKVPLQYSRKEKMQAKILADPDLDRPAAAVLPVISFELVPNGLVYAPGRKVTSLQRKVVKNIADKNKFFVQYIPVPYDIHFNLYVYVKFPEDGHKIIEQILPFFTPDYTLSVELVPEMNDTRDIVITMNSISLDDQYDGKFENRQMMVWTLGFTMHGYFFGPVKNKPMIKFIILNNRLAAEPVNYAGGQLPSISNNNPIYETTTVQPGLTANGQPTTDVTQTIDYHLIAVDDAWGYAIDTKKDPDG